MDTAPVILDIPGVGKPRKGSEGMVIARSLWFRAIRSQCPEAEVTVLRVIPFVT